MSPLGELAAVQMATYENTLHTEFSEVVARTYHMQVRAIIDALPNAKRYIRLGEATLSHSMEGFVLEGVFSGEPFRLKKPVSSMYSCHIEYDYFGRGDCVDLSTLDDTYYIYPQEQACSVTKMALATEELFFSCEHNL